MNNILKETINKDFATNLDEKLIEYNNKVNIQIEHIDMLIKQSQTWAQYWMIMASCGSATNDKRHIFHGPIADNNELTLDEKIEQCMITARTHLRNAQELIDKKVELMNELLK